MHRLCWKDDGQVCRLGSCQSNASRMQTGLTFDWQGQSDSILQRWYPPKRSPSLHFQHCQRDWKNQEDGSVNSRLRCTSQAIQRTPTQDGTLLHLHQRMCNNFKPLHIHQEWYTCFGVFFLVKMNELLHYLCLQGKCMCTFFPLLETILLCLCVCLL